MAQKFVGEEALDKLIGYLKPYVIKVADWKPGDTVVRSTINNALRLHKNLYISSDAISSHEYQLSGLHILNGSVISFIVYDTDCYYVYVSNATTGYFTCTKHVYPNEPEELTLLTADEITSKFA